MRCNNCKGRCNLIGFNLEKCVDCGKEQTVVFEPSLRKIIKDKIKKVIGRNNE